MQIKSKYKIARRLGMPIFEKTQTAKYAARLGRRKEQSRKHPRTFTDYGRQLLEKQKLRYTYLLNERQTKKYVASVLAKKGVKQDEKLFETLERRLDNVVYRLGLATTRLAVRQMVSHGHILVNGKRVNVPSYGVDVGDKVTIRPASRSKKLFQTLEERLKSTGVPTWLKFDAKTNEAEVLGTPKLISSEIGIDLNTVLEYYKR